MSAEELPILTKKLFFNQFLTIFNQLLLYQQLMGGGNPSAFVTSKMIFLRIKRACL